MTKYNERHGGPYDRGAADYWYHRPPQPHYYVKGTGTSDRVGRADMTETEIEAYFAGYDEAEADGGQKDYR